MMQTPPDCIGPLNIGNPEEITINELAELILRITKSNSKIKYAPLPVDDPQRRSPDISLAREFLNGWHPLIPLEEGLKRTISYFKQKI